eukprot:1716482-Pyramimonas_sp.AAC.1
MASQTHKRDTVSASLSRQFGKISARINEVRLCLPGRPTILTKHHTETGGTYMFSRMGIL